MNSAQLQIKKANDLRNSGHGVEAAKIYASVRDRCLSSGDLQSAAEAEHMRGVSYEIENDINNALPAYKSAASLYARSGDPLGAGRVMRDEAIMYEYVGDLQLAHKLLLDSIEILENVHKKLNSKQTLAELGVNYIKLGNIRIKQEDPIYGEEALTKGIDMVGRAGHWFYLATGLMHKAQLYTSTSEFEHALDYLTKSEELFDKHNKDDHSRRKAQIIGLRAHILSNIDPVKNKIQITRMIDTVEELLIGVSASSKQKVYEDILYNETMLSIK